MREGAGAPDRAIRSLVDSLSLGVQDDVSEAIKCNGREIMSRHIAAQSAASHTAGLLRQYCSRLHGA